MILEAYLRTIKPKIWDLTLWKSLRRDDSYPGHLNYVDIPWELIDELIRRWRMAHIFHFLELPTELRNRVYHHVLEQLYSINHSKACCSLLSSVGEQTRLSGDYGVCEKIRQDMGVGIQEVASF